MLCFVRSGAAGNQRLQCGEGFFADAADVHELFRVIETADAFPVGQNGPGGDGADTGQGEQIVVRSGVQIQRGFIRQNGQAEGRLRGNGREGKGWPLYRQGEFHAASEQADADKGCPCPKKKTR